MHDGARRVSLLRDCHLRAARRIGGHQGLGEQQTQGGLEQPLVPERRLLAVALKDWVGKVDDIACRVAGDGRIAGGIRRVHRRLPVRAKVVPRPVEIRSGYTGQHARAGTGLYGHAALIDHMLGIGDCRVKLQAGSHIVRGVRSLAECTQAKGRQSKGIAPRGEP